VLAADQVFGGILSTYCKGSVNVLQPMVHSVDVEMALSRWNSRCQTLVGNGKNSYKQFEFFLDVYTNLPD
jgi:hypothetical protein